MGFCDGSPEDVAELLSIAEAEGADNMKIHKKHLKSGREVWTRGWTGLTYSRGGSSWGAS